MKKKIFLLIFTFFVLVISETGAEPEDDGFIEGYVSAVLEREFKLVGALMGVDDGVITLNSRVLEGVDREKVIPELSKIKGVIQVNIKEPVLHVPPTDPAYTAYEQSTDRMKEQINEGNLQSKPAVFPKEKLFEPLIADPRWPHFSASFHNYIDDDELQSVGATSFGETIPLYRDDAFFGGKWQIGLQAGVFAIFDLDAESLDLVNADYWVGIPVSYRYEDISALLRVFHQSSHLGDEFLLRSRIDRVNLSYESVDAKLSYDFNRWLRIYSGGGFIFNKEPSDLDPWSTQFGLEIEGPSAYLGNMVRPVAGLDIKSWDENDWDADISLRLGIQIEKAEMLGTTAKKIQFMLEYFQGHSPNGQFYERLVEYIGLGTHFYF